jgi:hypothetical protein
MPGNGTSPVVLKLDRTALVCVQGKPALVNHEVMATAQKRQSVSNKAAAGPVCGVGAALPVLIYLK